MEKIVEYLKGLLNNRISVLMVLFHWIFFLLLFSDFNSYFVGTFQFKKFLFWETLSNIVFILDYPAILVAVILWSPYYFIEQTTVYSYGAIATSFFTITLQWLMIGKLVSRVIDRRNQKVIEVSIFDAN